MLTKKTITYVDFDGEDKTEDFYFNLTKAELTELASDYPEGLMSISTESSKKKISII